MKQGPPSCGCKFMLGCLPHQICQLMNQNQPGVGRQQLHGKFAADRKEKCVGELAVVMPFPISAKIGEVGFDLDADKAAVWAESEDIRPSSVGQANLVQG